MAHRSYESDRDAFLGRGGTCLLPQGLFKDNHVGKTGHVLHPIMSLGRSPPTAPTIHCTPGFPDGAAPTRQQAIALAKRYHDATFIQRAIDRVTKRQ
jgi:hypothetical protein